MNTPPRVNGRLPLKALALGLGIGVFSGSLVMAFQGEPEVSAKPPKGTKGGLFGRRITENGTLGYKPGVYPGFPGFGLGYHPGYGYGGAGLGTGAGGGFPLYAGPGYPHCEPKLRRIGGITPFPFYGGPGYPRVGYTNYFQPDIGPLVVQPPVAPVTDRAELDFGSFTGALPYPETAFAPYAGEETGSSTGTVPPSQPPNP